MKLKIFILFLLFLGNGQAQVVLQDEIKKDTIVPFFMIFEHVWVSNNTSRKYTTEGIPNYFQMENGWGMIFSSVRNNNILFEGTIENFNVSQEDSLEVKRFYIAGTNRTLGVRASFELFKLKEGKYELHFYNKLGSMDIHFIGHEATDEEVENIRWYFNPKAATGD